MSRFAGKSALITGAAGGIGRELCLNFAAEGAKIGAIDRDDKLSEFVEELRSAGTGVSAAICDIGDAAAVRDAVDRIEKDLGAFDIVVNNAGFSGAPVLEQTTAEIWASDINGNLNGAYHCTSAAIEGMKEKGGAIVNISSINGIAALGDPAYSAAKAGLISYTKSLAMEYGRFGIRANVICPGTVRTPIWDHRIEREPEIFEQLVRWYPLKRVADPIDIARVVMFLASEDAAAITGAMLPVDCGLSAGNIVLTRELTVTDL